MLFCFMCQKLFWKCDLASQGSTPKMTAEVNCRYEVNWVTEYACHRDYLESNNCKLTSEQHDMSIDLTPLTLGREYFLFWSRYLRGPAHESRPPDFLLLQLSHKLISICFLFFPNLLFLLYYPALARVQKWTLFIVFFQQPVNKILILAENMQIFFGAPKFYFNEFRLLFSEKPA